MTEQDLDMMAPTSLCNFRDVSDEQPAWPEPANLLQMYSAGGGYEEPRAVEPEGCLAGVMLSRSYGSNCKEPGEWPSSSLYHANGHIDPRRRFQEEYIHLQDGERENIRGMSFSLKLCPGFGFKQGQGV